MNDEIKTLHELTAGINKLQRLTNEHRGKQTSCIKQPNRSVRAMNKLTEQSIAASVASANPEPQVILRAKKPTVAAMFFLFVFPHKLSTSTERKTGGFQIQPSKYAMVHIQLRRTTSAGIG